MRSWISSAGQLGLIGLWTSLFSVLLTIRELTGCESLLWSYIIAYEHLLTNSAFLESRQLERLSAYQ